MKIEKAKKASPDTNDNADEIRRRIIDASIRFMSIHGSQKLSMVEVAELAGVARATIYNYFGSKESLIEAAEYSMDQLFFEGLRDSVAKYTHLDDRVASMAAFIRQCWTDRDHTPWYGFLSPLDEAVLVVSHSADHYRRLGEFITPFLLEAQKRGEVRDSLNPARTADWLARLVLSFALEPADQKMNDPAEIFRFFKEHLLPGLAPENSRRPAVQSPVRRTARLRSPPKATTGRK